MDRKRFLPGILSSPLRITLLYLLLGILWILFSDMRLEAALHLALSAPPDSVVLTFFQTLKGWLYILVTSGLLFFLVARAQRSLESSKANLTLLIESTNDCIWAVDRERRLVALNSSARGLFAAVADVDFEIGMEALPRLPEPLRLRWQDLYTRALEGEAFTVEQTYTLPQGIRHFEVTLNPQRIGGQSCEQVSVFARDVTERQQAETALRESEYKYRTLFTTSTDAIFVETLYGDVLDCNEAACRIFGYTREELLELTVADLVPDAVAATLPDLITEELATGGIFVEAENKRKDGAIFPVEVSTRLINLGGEPCVLAYVRDITVRKQVERALQEERQLLARRVAERTADLSAVNAELAHAARAKDEFLASMSHELRTPLNAVLGISEALQEGFYGALQERQHHALDNITESGRHLLSLINDILEFSKIEAGKLTLEVAPVGVDSLCEASLRMIEPAAQQKALEIVFEGDLQVRTVPADGRRLKQVLVNLLGNAVKFTPTGGRIGLKVRGDAENARVAFQVWDTGIGISAEDLGQIFNPFVQIDSSLNKQYAGTGLGLALVQRMVDLHGGSITVESRAGQGSRFTVNLPWALPPEAPTSSALVGPLVLLAEDSEIALQHLHALLREAGYAVMVARNGVEAVERALESPPALILLDLELPELDGWEVGRRLANYAQLATIPRVALTALALPGAAARSQRQGFVGYFPKPVSRSQLLTLLAHYIKEDTDSAEAFPRASAH